MASNAVGSAPGDQPTLQHDAPTTELLAGAVGSQCTNCHAPLASDQRYCVNCGERRGKPRFPAAASSSTTAVTTTEHPPAQRAPRAAGATLVAGVATLLIAIGVGVLIGHDSSTPPTRAAAPTVVTVAGGSSAPPAAAAASAGKHTKGVKASTAKGNPAKIKTVTVHLTPKVTKAATNAASKVFGSSGKLSNNVTQKVNGSCTGGAGCQNGKFTGNFFGQ